MSTSSTPSFVELETTARVLRREIITAVHRAKAGHLGGPLSAADLLTALYFHTLNIRPSEPEWPDRDRFVLSKGHSSIALYAVLALRGYFPLDELRTFDEIDSRLQGHPDMKVLPGVDMSTGSLGLGLAAGVGIALGAKLTRRTFLTYVMVGDGECNEGIVWEAAHVAQRYALDNLVVIIDHNQLQQFGWRDDSASRRRAPYLANELRDRWEAFGWAVLEVDGHNITSIARVLDQAKATRGLPTAVIAQTIKGKGVSFMEDNFRWHTGVPTDEQLQSALAELSSPPTLPGDSFR